MKNKKGFTLVELLAVIVIISILAMLAIPNVTERVNDSRKKSFLEEARTIVSTSKSNYASGSYEMVNGIDESKKNKVIYSKDAIDSILVNKLGKSPFGDNYKDAGMIIHKIKDQYGSVKYEYFICLIDEGGNGFDYTNEKDLNMKSFNTEKKVTNCTGLPAESYKVEVNVYQGTVDESLKIVYEDEDAVFNLTPSANILNPMPTVSCTNKQKGTIVNNVLTVSKVSESTTCNVTYNGTRTVLYNDGTFIINEKPENARNNEINHKGIKGSPYPALSNSNQYMFAYASSRYWDDDSKSILKVEIGDNVKPVSTRKWFFGFENTIEMDLSKLDTSDVTDMNSMFYNCASLEYIDLSNFDTSNVKNMSGMFWDCHKLKSLNLNSFDTSNVTDMSYMFNSMFSIESISINTTTFDTSKVTNMSDMFYRCYKLTDLDVSHFNTSSLVNMSNMFQQCESLETLDVSNWNTSKVTDMSSAFRYCGKVKVLDVSNFDTSNVTNMHGVFDMMHSVSVLDTTRWDTSKVTDMSSLFRWIENVKVLDLRNFDTSNVTNMSEMFYNDYGLETLDVSSFDTSKVTDMNYMFAYVKLENFDISNFDTRNVTNMQAMFYAMSNLKNLSVGSKFITSKVTNFGMMFDECYHLSFDFHKLDTSSAVEMYRMLGNYGSYTRETLDVSNFDTSHVTDMMGMFGSVKSKIIRLDNFDFSKVIYHGGNPYKNSSVNAPMFWGLADDTIIYVKDNSAKSFVEARLQEVNKSNQVLIAS